jgi:hypothetical protein
MYFFSIVIAKYLALFVNLSKKLSIRSLRLKTIINFLDDSLKNLQNNWLEIWQVGVKAMFLHYPNSNMLGKAAPMARLGWRLVFPQR